MPSAAPSRVAFWLVAYLFAIGMLGTTLPTPLYVLYESRFGFSSGVITLIYATYALGVIASLAFAGRASDAAGRRPLLAMTIGLAAASTVVFILAGGVGLLFAGRLLSGLAAGILTGTATAMLSELSGASSTRRASLVATVANMGGLGLGPLVAGLFAAFLPRPTVLVFEVYLVLLASAGACLVASPETVAERRAPSLGFGGFGVPAAGRREFVAASAAGFSAFTLLGLFSALAPSFLGGVLHEHSSAVAGAVVFLIFGVATAAEVVLSGFAPRRAVLVGLAWLLVALALITAGLSGRSIGLFLVGTAAGGLATGLVFMGSLGMANALAPRETRGQVVSTYFLVAYVGLTIPVIGVGVSAEHVGDFRATLACAVGLAVVAVLSAAVIRRATATVR